MVWSRIQYISMKNEKTRSEAKRRQKKHAMDRNRLDWSESRTVLLPIVYDIGNMMKFLSAFPSHTGDACACERCSV